MGASRYSVKVLLRTAFIKMHYDGKLPITGYIINEIFTRTVKH